MEIKRKRLDWIDAIKGFCMFTIVLMHIQSPIVRISNPGYIYINHFTSLYKVSLFFVVAGFTLNNEKLNKARGFIKHKLTTVYYKLVIVGILAVLLHNLFIEINFYNLDFNYEGKQVVIYHGVDMLKNLLATLLCANREVIIGPMWFMAVLFIAFMGLTIINFFVNRIIKSRNKRLVRLFITCVLMIVSWIFSVKGYNINRVNNAFTAIFLIDLGNYLYNSNFIYSKVTVILAVPTVMILPLFGAFSLNNNKIVNPMFLVITVVAYTSVFIYISKKIEKTIVCKVFSYLGRNSFYIMALQFFSFKLGTVIKNLILQSKDITYYLTPTTYGIIDTIYMLVIGLFLSAFIGQGCEKLIQHLRNKVR